MKLEICSFSGHKIYPSRGKLYVRLDSRVFRFINGKAESLFLQKKNPRKIHWTVVFRKMHKKGITEEVAKKRTRRTVKYQRAVVGATWDDIKAKRTQKPEEREQARNAAINKAKEKKKAEQAKKTVDRKAQQAQKAVKNAKAARAPNKAQASSKR